MEYSNNRKQLMEETRERDQFKLGIQEGDVRRVVEIVYKRRSDEKVLKKKKQMEEFFSDFSYKITLFVYMFTPPGGKVKTKKRVKVIV